METNGIKILKSSSFLGKANTFLISITIILNSHLLPLYRCNQSHTVTTRVCFQDPELGQKGVVPATAAKRFDAQKSAQKA